MYKLVKYPDPLLKTKSEPIVDFNKQELEQLSKDMILAMVENNGRGLSAIQIGKPVRYMVMMQSFAATLDDKTAEPVYLGLCNPQVIKYNGRFITEEEGCLSFPGIYANVERQEDIEVRWYNIDGKEYITEFKGIDARCILHEIDHMDGITFIDRLPQHVRFKIQDKLLKLKRAYGRLKT